jgi:outer membrane protein
MKRSILPAVVLSLLVLTGPVLGELKLGYINSNILKERLPEFKDAQRQFDQLRQKYEREIGDRQSKLLKMQEDFQKQELLMSESRKAELRTEFEEKRMQLMEFEAKKMGPEGELVQKNIELSAPIFEWINDSLQHMGREEGYDFIFDVGGTGAIVYVAEEKYDLTEQLLDRLNESRAAREQEEAKETEDENSE